MREAVLAGGASCFNTLDLEPNGGRRACPEKPRLARAGWKAGGYKYQGRAQRLSSDQRTLAQSMCSTPTLRPWTGAARRMWAKGLHGPSRNPGCHMPFEFCPKAEN